VVTRKEVVYIGEQSGTRPGGLFSAPVREVSAKHLAAGNGDWTPLVRVVAGPGDLVGLDTTSDSQVLV